MRSYRIEVVATAAVAVWMVGCTESKPPPAAAVPPAAKVVSFAASADVVDPGEQVTLFWQTADAERVVLRDLAGREIALPAGSEREGSMSLAVDEDIGLVLTAWGEGGSDRAAISVLTRKESPTLLFAAVPSQIAAGERAALLWNAPGASSVVLRAGQEVLHQTADTSGSFSVSPGFSTTYTIEAGDRTAQAEIAVGPAIVAFASSALAAVPGEAITLSWRVGGASRVTLSADGRGTLAETTAPEQMLDGSFQDTIPSGLPTNGVVTYRLTAEAGEVQLERVVVVSVSSAPRVTLFHVDEVAKVGGKFLVRWQVEQADRVEISVAGEAVYAVFDAERIRESFVQLPTPSEAVEVALKATNDLGGVTIEKRTVEPIGLPAFVSFTASPAHLPQGGYPVTLSWEITNARRVTIVAKGQYEVARIQGAAAATGSIDVYPNKATDYEIVADNSLGDAIAPRALSVTVGSPATFTFNPTTAPAGANVTITSSSVPSGGDVMGLPWVQKNKPGDAFVDISATGFDTGLSWYDESAIPVGIPTFSTRIHGQPITSDWISVSPNGWFAFYDDYYWDSDWDPFSFPTNWLLPLAIAPFWCDLYAYDSRILYLVDGVGDARRLIVQWDNVMYDPAWVPVTFQAQVYASGKVVFAYKDVSASGAMPGVGIVDADETGALMPPGPTPADGDVFTFFDRKALPGTITASAQPFTLRQFIGTTGAFIDIESTYPVLPPGQFEITEVNPNPPSSVSGGQWFEVTNNTANGVDLGGWNVDFGGGNVHTISGSLILPANGRLLFSQTSTAGDGLTADYAWGTTQSMSAGAIVGLSIAGGVYTKVSLPAGALKEGYAWQRAPLGTGVTAASGVTSLECSAHSGSTYGTHGQRGTPGQANTTCPAYQTAASITSAFESISGVGTAIPFNDSDADVQAVTPPEPFVLGNVEWSTLYVGTNGWISLYPLTCFGYPCYDENKWSPDGVTPFGFIAPYWDDLEMAPGTAFWLRRDPDGLPSSGDEYTIVSWENVRRWATSSDDLNFQVKFFDTGTVEFHFGTMTGGTGGAATTWFEDPSGLAAYVINVNSSSPGIQSNTAFRFSQH